MLRTEDLPLAAYPRPSVAADIAILTIALIPRQAPGNRRMLPLAELRVLLIRRRSEPFGGRWALPGGFLRPGETLDAAARRELEEETRVGGVALHHLANYSEPERDPRGWVISAAYCALVDATRLPDPAGASDAAEARWVPLREALGLALAFDHGLILADAYRWVQRQVLTSLVVRDFLPETFVLAELHGVLRAIVPDYHEELANFRRKVLVRRIIEPTGHAEPRYSRRPAQLFRFTGEQPRASLF